MRYSLKCGQYLPMLDNGHGQDPVAFALCPGKGYKLVADAERLFGYPGYDQDLGQVRTAYAAHSMDTEVLAHASSGGVMSQIAIHLIETGRVDKVLVTDFDYTSGPRAHSRLARSRSEVLSAQGSKYCPVELSQVVQEIRDSVDRVAVLGTPCQIAGIRNIQKVDPEFSRKIVLCVSTFCGGIKNYHNLHRLSEAHGIAPERVRRFRFRGGGQPGSMLIQDEAGTTVEHPYPAYVGLTGISKHQRCHLCVDATGELADIACGDAWLPRFRSCAKPWSIVLARSEVAVELIQEMLVAGEIDIAPVSLQEVKISQRENLASKKARQRSRRRLYAFLGHRLPEFDGGYPDNPLDLLTELKVLAKHRFKALLERLRLYRVCHRPLARRKAAASTGAAATAPRVSGECI